MQSDVGVISMDEGSIFSLISILQNANVVVQGVVFILVVLSVYSWCIIIRSSFNLRTQRKKIGIFNVLLSNKECSAEALQIRASSKKQGCMASNMLNVALKYLRAGGEVNSTKFENSMRIEIERALFAQEKHLAGLANVSSLSPFIGLFGTIIGIMHSFSSIFTMQSISLKIIAPSISEALFATAVGIFVAVPAGLFYNKLVNDTRYVRTEAEALICGVTQNKEKIC